MSRDQEPGPRLRCGFRDRPGLVCPQLQCWPGLHRRLAEASAARLVLAKCPRTLPPLTGPWGQGARAGPVLGSNRKARAPSFHSPQSDATRLRQVCGLHTGGPVISGRVSREGTGWASQGQARAQTQSSDLRSQGRDPPRLEGQGKAVASRVQPTTRCSFLGAGPSP